MNLFKAVQKAISNKWFVSALLAILVFIALPTKTNQLIIDLQIIESLGDFETFQMIQVPNQSSYKHVISYYNEEERRFSAIIKDEAIAIDNQYNIYDCYALYGNKSYFEDLDGDNYPELFVPVLQNNEIRIHVFSPFTPQSPYHDRSYLIERINGNPGPNDFRVPDLCLVQVNDGGTKELLLIVYGQYDYFTTRKLVRLNLDSEQMICSQTDCNIITTLDFMDIDGDGVEEIFGDIGSPYNSEGYDGCIYADQHAGLMIFNQQLELINDPRSATIAGPFTSVYLYQIESKVIGVAHQPRTKAPPNFVFELRKDFTIEPLFELDPAEIRLGNFGCLVGTQFGPRVVIGSKSGDLGVIDTLGLVSKFKVPYSISVIQAIDLNQDNQDEIVLYNNQDDQVCFYNLSGRLIGKYQFNVLTVRALRSAGSYHDGTQLTNYLDLASDIYQIQGRQNLFHYLKWLLIVGLFLIFVLLFEFISWTQRKQIEERNNLEQQVKKLQIQSVKNQLDPHFTFNALNVLSFLAKEDDKDGLDNFVNHFSKLLRQQVETSDKSYTTLYDELRFVEHYIELQKLRFEQPIEYDLDVQGGLDMNLRIPKMIIHTHVENAIKHGLIPAGGGRIWVRINKPNNHTQIEIENNGSPRSESSGEKNGSTGKGLAILNQLYDLFYQLYKVKIKQEIIDLKDTHGNPTGTKVIIKL